jgi:phthalate 4,5-cis-dihydrodiol dehydrogenase
MSHHTTTDECARPIKLGIAGLGLAGAMMIRAAIAHPRIQVCAAADPLVRPRATFERNLGARTYSDFRGLCDDREVEAIYIATPHQFHAQQAVEAIRCGKHVLIEKPLALTLEDCDSVIEAAELSDVHAIVGHTHAFDPNVRAMHGIVERNEIGRLGMIVAFNYTDFLYRPRRPEELDTSQGGGIVFNQVSHQIEIARLIGGGLVRSVRANAAVLDSKRPTEGSCAALLEFENGAAASLVYSGYDFFDSDELHNWVAEGGTLKSPAHGSRRREIVAGAIPERELQMNMGYGGRVLPTAQPFLPHFGIWIITAERGELRLSPNGIIKYDLDGPHEIAVSRGLGRPGHGDALDVLWSAVRENRNSIHGPRWGKATLEVALAIVASARQQREVNLNHQVASDGAAIAKSNAPPVRSC